MRKAIAGKYIAQIGQCVLKDIAESYEYAEKAQMDEALTGEVKDFP